MPFFTSPSLSDRSDSTNSSKSGSLSSSRGSVAESGSEERCRRTLEMHHIFVDSKEWETQKWDQLALTLGFSTNSEKRSGPEASKLARNISRKKSPSKKQVVEAVRPFVSSLVGTQEVLSIQQSTEYYYDAVPSIEHLRNSILRLPVPKPTTSIGYRKELFSNAQVELQNGLISDPNGAPADLSRISQPAPGHYWPFFVVEVSDVSLLAAQQACAISAGTCNNAIEILSIATQDLTGPYVTREEWESTSVFGRVFSLAICGRVASLNTHICTVDTHIASTIKVYQLDVESEVADLANRLRSIMIWGQHGRLEHIGNKLNSLNQRVNQTHRRQLPATHNLHPSMMQQMQQQQAQRRSEVMGLGLAKQPHDPFYDDTEFSPVRYSAETVNNQSQIPLRRRRRDMMKIAFEAGLPSFMKEDM